MEVRGIGIIDVKAMFGIQSVCNEKTVDLVVTLKEWQKGENNRTSRYG
jgi:HPr kinase/phosphorylase